MRESGRPHRWGANATCTREYVSAPSYKNSLSRVKSGSVSIVTIRSATIRSASIPEVPCVRFGYSVSSG
jgi:hypothetical protein